MRISLQRAAAAVAAMLVVFVLSSCATTSDRERTAVASDRDCMFARTLSDWRPLDNRNLILFGNGRRPYHVELVRPAMNLSSNIQIGVYDRDGLICPYGGDAIIVDGALPDRISIRSMRELTDDELQGVYERFGIRTPVVVEAEAVELEQED